MGDKFYLFILQLNFIINYLFSYIILKMGIGDWGLGIGDWGLGPIPNPQSPIPNPQSPFNKHLLFIINSYL